MAVTATALPYQHEFILPYAGPTALAGPWTVLRTSSISTVHLFQNTTTSEVTLSTGVAARPTLSVPPGDTILAVTDLSVNQETVLVGRLPHSGRRYTTTKNVGATSIEFPLSVPEATYDAGDAFLAFGGVRGACGGVIDASLNVTWSGGSGVPGFVELASVTGVATQPTGDANGNVGTAAASVLTTGGSIPQLVGSGGGSGPCSFPTQRWQVLGYVIISTEPLDLDAARVRATVSEDAGSLFQATQAVAVELGISEAFAYGTDLGSGLRAFREALTPDEVAVRYYPLPTRNQEMLTTVEGETNLGRLASTYPAAIMLPASVIPGALGGVVTAQQAIQHVLDSWANAHSWLTFEAVPDLRLLEPGAVAAPRQHYVDHASAGVLTTVAVVIPQDGTDRRSMRDILDEWLAIFPGTVVRQTSSGSIELVPRVGPDAPVDAALTLTWRDLLAVSDGDADPRGVINRARVTSQGWEFTESQTLAPPAFMLFTGGGGINRDVLEGEAVIPTDQEEYQPGRTMPFTVFVDAGSAVTVTVAITAFGSWSPTSSSAFSVEGTASPSATLDVGQSREVSITHNSRSQDVTSRWRLTRISSVAIDVQPISVVASASNVFGSTYFAYLLEFDVVGTAWVRTNESVTGEFGQAGAGLPGEGGGDAIATSRAQYGERLAQLQSNVFQLTIEQAQAVAQSYVLWNINPRTIRDVQQSEWNKFPVKFDHVGRHVDLPTGERAVVENRAYSDSFAPGGGTMQSTFTATVTEVVIDTSTDWLLLDNGDFFALDSGTLVEVS